MRGSEQIAATVDLTKVTKPTGIIVTKDTYTTSPTLTISASTSFTTAGVVRIPVVVDGDITINKDFSVAIAFTGQTGGKGDPGDAGKGVASVAIDYQASASNTTAPTGTWSAIISVGADNSYGHPSDEVLSRLEDAGAIVMRTDQMGTIICVSDGQSIVFQEYNSHSILSKPWWSYSHANPIEFIILERKKESA